MSHEFPVFLVGSVRTGSTLLRLMLDSHPHITNPGECDFLFELVDDNGRFPDILEYRRWLSTDRIFLEKQIRVDEDLTYFDLMQSFLGQFEREGAILSMNVHRHFNRIPCVFPDARYIHLLRDPRDVARSCIGMGWAGHVHYGVNIWQEAENSWDKIKSSLRNDQYLEIKYEDLLEDVKGILTKICEFIGLEYSDRMMDYSSHTTYAPPDNKLIYQWKKKYSKRELQLVEGKVGKMLVAREYELSGYPPELPDLFEAWMLAVQNKKYCIRYQIERYGLSLYLESIMASRSGFRFWMDSCQKRKNLIAMKFLK
jgi:LPS sulfotransferase NodH